jgi:hypothetical protein
MTMIDQVAAAIADARGGAGPTFAELFPNRERGEAIIRLVAKVAIRAMREPTEAMILANSDAGGPDDEHTKADWRAMIDAALSE